MITLITEKPSVATSISKIVRAYKREDGYFDGGTLNGEPCCVTWAMGHLVEIRPPFETPWSLDGLPYLPDHFDLTPRTDPKTGKPDSGYVKQLSVIKKLFQKSSCIVNCGDAGREGEVIQRYIYQYVGYNGPVKRLWISSMTDEAIREGLRNLEDGKNYDSLFEAGKARSEADWLVGINATIALTVANGGNRPGMPTLSAGRVQTVVQALICQRYLENKNFVPQDFWRQKITTSKDGIEFTFLGAEKYDRQDAAEKVRQALASSDLKVESVEKNSRTVKAPLPYDLGAYQKDAARRYGLSVKQALDILQTLYEKHHLVTYPRTGSRYITDDIMPTVPSRLEALKGHPTLGETATTLAAGKLNRRCVNAGKVTDHHALLIEKTVAGDLSDLERKMYDLVATRTVEAFSPDCEEEVTKVVLSAAGLTFCVSSVKILKAGWKAVRNEAEEITEDESGSVAKRLPELTPGESLKIEKAELHKGQTKPQPLFTEATILTAMENAGSAIEDEELKDAIKDCGIGTPATRAGILETLKRRQYITVDGKKLIPTQSGLQVYDIVKDMMLCNVRTTAQWEQALNLIAVGKLSPDKFRNAMTEFTKQTTRQLIETSKSGMIQRADDSVKCPACGGKMKVWDTNAKCCNKDCGLYFGRTVCGKKLSEKTTRKLLETGKTGTVKGLKSKEGKEFDAKLKLKIVEKDGKRYANAELVFDKKFGSKKK